MPRDRRPPESPHRYAAFQVFSPRCDRRLRSADLFVEHPNIKADDNPDDTGRVSADTERLLLDALYPARGRWHAPASQEEDDLPQGNGGALNNRND